MTAIPKKVTERLSKEIGRFQRVLKHAKDRDVNESDTVTIVTDMLSAVFGFDKYTEITSEQAIRGTYCDLAVKTEGNISYLIEVKAIGLALKENHLRQAVNYGANHGIPWVVLTNGDDWEIYRIRFERPIDFDLICRFTFTELSGRSQSDQEMLFLLCKEGISKAAIEEFHKHIQVVNRFAIAAIIQDDAVIGVIRKELRRLAEGVKVTKEEIEKIVGSEVLKRDVVSGEAADRARAHVKKMTHRTARHTKRKEPTAEVHEGEPDEEHSDVDLS